MSGFYNGITAQLMSWTLGEKPASVILRVATVSDEYVFAPEHLGPDITGILNMQDLDGTLVESTVICEEISLTEMVPGNTIQGFVFFFAWEGGTKPICFINQATDLNLPFIVVSSEITVRFPPEGIFKI